MTTLVLEADPIAVDVRFGDGRFTVILTDGRALTIPVEWYPRLYHATQAERKNWQLLGVVYVGYTEQRLLTHQPRRHKRLADRGIASCCWNSAARTWRPCVSPWKTGS